jgi:hypothetical protein
MVPGGLAALAATMAAISRESGAAKQGKPNVL